MGQNSSGRKAKLGIFVGEPVEHTEHRSYARRHAMISITLISKSGGPLSKRIWLDAHVQVQSDGSTCVMARAEAVRPELRSADDLAFVIDAVKSNQALVLGALRDGLGDQVEIVTQAEINRAPRSGITARLRTCWLIPRDLSARPLQTPWKVFPYGRCKAMILGRPDGSLPFLRRPHDLRLKTRLPCGRSRAATGRRSGT